jgi:hypothetical protein
MQSEALMTTRRIIKADRLVADIRRRVSDFELMEKYQISLEQLDKVLEKLVEKNLLRRDELDERGAHFDDPNNRIVTRRAPRHYLRLPLIVQDIYEPSRAGLVTDLSTAGFRTRDLKAVCGETRSFVIRSKDPMDRNIVEVTAVCRWTRSDCSGQTDRFEAGFEILDISEHDRARIRLLIQKLSIGDRNAVTQKYPRGFGEG